MIQRIEGETLLSITFDAKSATIKTNCNRYVVAGEKLTEVGFSTSEVFNQRICDAYVDLYKSEDMDSDDGHAVGDFTIATESGFIDFQLTAPIPMKPTDYPFTFSEL